MTKCVQCYYCKNAGALITRPETPMNRGARWRDLGGGEGGWYELKANVGISCLNCHQASPSADGSIKARRPFGEEVNDRVRLKMADQVKLDELMRRLANDASDRWSEQQLMLMRSDIIEATETKIKRRL